MAVEHWSAYSGPIAVAEAVERPTRPASVLDQALFERALLRERGRSERSDNPTVLVVFTLADGASSDRSLWNTVVSAIAASKRETDVLGWVKPSVALGVILTEVRVTGDAAASAFDRRVCSEFVKLLDHATAGKLSIRAHLYPETSESGLPSGGSLESPPPWLADGSTPPPFSTRLRGRQT